MCEGGFHVSHYLAHGELEEELGHGMLVLEDEVKKMLKNALTDAEK